jgi:hypothetical protein
MTVAATNYVGSVTLAANTAVGLFGSASPTISPTTGVWSLQGIPDGFGICQVNSASSPSTEVAYTLPSSWTFQTGSAEIFLYNPTNESVTFTVRFASVL